MSGGVACGLEQSCELGVDNGRIHPDEQIGRLGQQTLTRLITYGDNAPVVAQHLDITPHGQFFVWPPCIKTLILHPWPTNANTMRLGPAQMHALNQQTREQIP